MYPAQPAHSGTHTPRLARPYPGRAPQLPRSIPHTPAKHFSGPDNPPTPTLYCLTNVTLVASGNVINCRSRQGCYTLNSSNAHKLSRLSSTSACPTNSNSSQKRGTRKKRRSHHPSYRQQAPSLSPPSTPPAHTFPPPSAAQSPCAGPPSARCSWPHRRSPPPAPPSRPAPATSARTGRTSPPPQCTP